MEKNIKVVELVKKLTVIPEAERLKWIKENIKSESYVPWGVKVSLAKNIVKMTSYKLKKEDGKYITTNNIEIDSNNRFVLSAMKAIDCWTNIKLSENIANDFDDLNRLGVIDIIIKSEHGIIPARELNEFNTIVESCFNDLMTNEYESRAFISNQIAHIMDVADVILQPLAKKIDNMNDDDFEKFIGKLYGVVSKLKIVK